MVAALAYPFWFVVSPMVLFSDKKKEPFVHFHAFQALIFGALSAAGLLVSFFVMALLFRLISLKFFVANIAVGGILFFVLFSAYLILILADILIILYYAYRTFQGETFSIPYITPYVRKKISL